MNTATIYPMDKNSAAIARYHEMLSNYALGGLVTPKGRNYNEKDANIFDGGKEINVTVIEDFNAALQKSDTVIFLKSSGHIETSLYKSKLDTAKKEGKKIVISSSLEKLLQTSSIPVQYDHIIGPSKIKIDNFMSERRHYIDIPIILVYGMGDYCNKFEIQMSLRRKFLNMGNSVMQIGTKEYSELFGFESFPEFVFDSSISLTHRVLAFNEYIYQSLIKRPADVLIIGVPGGVAPLDDYFHNSFSELPYIISNALQPDISILSTYYFPQINEDFFLELRDYMKYKYNAIVDYFHIANYAYTIDNTDEIPELVYIKQNSEQVDEILQNSEFTSISVFNVYGDSCFLIMDKIFEELNQNIEII